MIPVAEHWIPSFKNLFGSCEQINVLHNLYNLYRDQLQHNKTTLME